MKYYFVDNVRVSDGASVPLLLPSGNKSKPNSKGAKKSGSKGKTSKENNQYDTIPVLKLRTVQRVPSRRSRTVPQLTRLRRRQGPLIVERAMLR